MSGDGIGLLNVGNSSSSFFFTFFTLVPKVLYAYQKKNKEFYIPNEKWENWNKRNNIVNLFIGFCFEIIAPTCFVVKHKLIEDYLKIFASKKSTKANKHSCIYFLLTLATNLTSFLSLSNCVSACTKRDIKFVLALISAFNAFTYSSICVAYSSISFSTSSTCALSFNDAHRFSAFSICILGLCSFSLFNFASVSFSKFVHCFILFIR